MSSYVDPGTPPPEQEPRPGWGQSLSRGAAGLALLHIAYAHAGIADWSTAHQWVQVMTRGPVAAHPQASLYQGAPAVAYVLRTAGRPAYATVLARLDQHIAEIIRTRLAQANERIDRGELPELREFDLINGLTGLGVHLLHISPGDLLYPHTDLLRDVLAYLVRLTGTITVNGAKLPGWWTTHGPSDKPETQWPGGHANLGLAHGISGPLALLSAALIRGVTVSRQAEAIDQTAGFLGRWRCGQRTRPWWPGMISAREWATATVDQPGPRRPSWCYGTPGLARARQLAGLALQNPQRRYRAEAALATCLTDNTQLGQLRDDSLCHGWAGLVHTARRAAADAEFGGELAHVLPRLESCWRRLRKQARPRLSDPGGMLEGSAGVTLTDLVGVPVAGWDACLLITVPPA